MNETGSAASADLLADLDARGLIHTSTDRDALAARLAEGPITAYYGCDPSAPSLHVGNLIGLLVLRRLHDAGHRAVALAGGATGLIGDPGGRSEERNLLDEATLGANVAGIRVQMERIVDPAGTGATRLVDNREWTEELTLLEFLRDIGKHATVNQMIGRESVRSRLDSEQGISFTEFSYMLLQARDYLWLNENLGVELQVGGSDQWGNIVSGVDLIRRAGSRVVHALCWPLLTAPDGTKLGKTTGARAWLDPGLTSPYRFYQHWIQVDDADVRRQLAWFTLLPVAEIDEIATAHAAAPEGRAGQRRLAAEVTTLVHGSDQAAAAAEASAVLFGGPPGDASPAALAAVAAEVTGIGADLRHPGADLIDLLVSTGLCGSRSEARRAIAQGGAYVNGERAAEGRRVLAEDALHGRLVVLRRGKKQFAAVRPRPNLGPDAAGP